mmetsp:Transcript_36024/g.95649  ORF Transcript_36024/g.95649 Transcript_36024/m.95649 type:complete len:82 (-) Transcript_36024:116-361(-)
MLNMPGGLTTPWQVMQLTCIQGGQLPMCTRGGRMRICLQEGPWPKRNRGRRLQRATVFTNLSTTEHLEGEPWTDADHLNYS